MILLGSISERPVALFGRAARKDRAGCALPVTCRRFMPWKPPRSGDEDPYPECPAGVHETAKRSGCRRIDAWRSAVLLGCPLSRFSLSHRDGTGQDQAPHPNIRE